jgi:hypothetical protein
MKLPATVAVANPADETVAAVGPDNQRGRPDALDARLNRV